MTEATKKAASPYVLRAISSILVALALVAMLVMGGCSSAASAAKLSQSVSGDSAMAMVKSVDGNTITVEVMEGGGQPGGDQQSGGQQSGDQQSGDQQQGNGDNGNGEAPSGNPPEKPGDGNGEAPSGNPPSGQPGDNASGDTSDSSASGTSENSSSESSKDDSSSTSESGSEQGGQGGPGGAGGPSGTEMTLTVNDESIIYTSSDGSETQGSLSDISENTMLQLTVSNGTDVTKIVVGGAGGPGGNGQGGSGGPGQGSSTVNNGTGATTYTSDESTEGKEYASTTSDENAVRTESGAKVTLTDATVTKSGDSSSAEDSDFYGLNAGVLAYDGSNLTVKGGTVSTESQGSNGIFAYGEGTEVNVSDTTIKTTKDNSGGIEVSGGATLTAKNLDVDTQGTSSAAIRSDRGGGTEVVTGGTYATHGHNSPAIYSTADVTVKKATLSAENSEGVVIEGKNSVTLEDTDLTGNVNGTTTRTGISSNVMIYQSMSGDASEGTGSFAMNGGTFTADNGTVFYVTNTDATIDLTDVDFKGSAETLLTVAGNDGVWGTSGSNGGTVTFTASKQKLAGAISVDDDSTLTLKLDDSSSYKGAINSDGQHGTVSVALESGSTWTLTADAYVSELSGDTSGIDLNGHTLYVNGEAWSK